MKVIKIIANQYLWLILIIVLAFAVRTYKIDSPIADWHSWRQVDTSAMTRDFIKHGLNPFYPQFDDMSGIAETPLPNTSHYRFVEFPIYNLFVYPFYLYFGVNPFFDRLVSVLFSLGSIVFIYLISRKYLDKFQALVASFIFALLPYNIFFSRVTLPEPTFVFFSLGMLYFVDKWIYKGDFKNGLAGFIFMMLAFLLKPWAIFYLPPLLYSIYKKNGFPNVKQILFFAFAISPFLLWRVWILQYPQGIPASGWLLNGDGIRFRPAWFWWIISERIGREILSVAGSLFFFLGLILRPRNGNYFLTFWALGQLLYLTVVATGNVRHDYYQTGFIPVAAIFTATGFCYLLRGSTNFIPRLFVIPFSILFFILMFYFGWTQIKGLYQINNPVIVEAGQMADKILPQDALVLAPYNGDTAFLYQTNRFGWPVIPLPIQEMVVDYGATTYISTTRDDNTKYAMDNFEVLVERGGYVIVDLTKPK